MVECTGLENRRGSDTTVGSNPTLSARYASAPARGRWRIWVSGCCGRTHHALGSTISSGTKLDRRRRAPQRSGGVRPMEGPNNPTLSARYASAPARGRWRIWVSGCCGRTHMPLGSTISSGTKLDRRRRAPQRSGGVRPMEGPNTISSGTKLDRRRRAPQRSGGVRPMEGPNNPTLSARYASAPERGRLSIPPWTVDLRGRHMLRARYLTVPAATAFLVRIDEPGEGM